MLRRCAMIGKSLDLRQLAGALRTRGGHFETPHADAFTKPFVTISSQAGSGGHTLALGLVERLNRFVHLSPDDPTASMHPWQSYDRELVQRIAQDHHLSTDYIESLNHSAHTWLEEFFRGM